MNQDSGGRRERWAAARSLSRGLRNVPGELISAVLASAVIYSVFYQLGALEAAWQEAVAIAVGAVVGAVVFPALELAYRFVCTAPAYVEQSKREQAQARAAELERRVAELEERLTPRIEFVYEDTDEYHEQTKSEAAAGDGQPRYFRGLVGLRNPSAVEIRGVVVDVVDVVPRPAWANFVSMQRRLSFAEYTQGVDLLPSQDGRPSHHVRVMEVYIQAGPEEKVSMHICYAALGVKEVPLGVCILTLAARGEGIEVPTIASYRVRPLRATSLTGEQTGWRVRLERMTEEES